MGGEDHGQGPRGNSAPTNTLNETNAKTKQQTNTEAKTTCGLAKKWEVVTTTAVTTWPPTDQLRITWSSHRSNSRKAMLDAITPARVKVCLFGANLMRRPSQLAGPSSLGGGILILPITPHSPRHISQPTGGEDQGQGPKGNSAPTNKLNETNAKTN